MALVPGVENLLGGHLYAPPPQPPFPKAFHGGPARFGVARMGGNEMGNRLAVARDGNGFTALDRAQQVGATRFGFRRLNLSHLLINNVLF